MKKLLVVSTFAVLGLTSAAFAGGIPEEMPAAPVAASSNDTGIYLGLQGGFGMTNWKNREVDSEKMHKDNGVVGRVFAGYDINRYFAVEGGYSYFFNKVKVGDADKAPELKTMAFDLMGKGKLPVIDSFDLYAKLGVDCLMTRFSGTNVDKDNINNFNLAYGAGADYSITPNVIVNLEWLRLNGKAKLNSDKYQPNTDSFMVGLRYKFDL